MKLSITQLIFGIFITLCYCFIISTLIWFEASIFNLRMSDGPGGFKELTVNNMAMLNLAKAGVFIVFACGFIIVAAGITALVKTGWQKVTNLVFVLCGVIVTVFSYIVTIWGFPSSFTVMAPSDSNFIEHIFTSFGPQIELSNELSGITVLLGLAVLGCGIAQIVKYYKAKMLVNRNPVITG